jgi:hypothetical protein
MAQRGSRLHDFNMDTLLRRPNIGDRVRLTGFLGVFEVVRIVQDASLVDLKHLDFTGPDYIEQEVCTQDLIYLNAQQLAILASRTAPQPSGDSRRASASGVPRESTSQTNRRRQMPSIRPSCQPQEAS